MTRRVGTSSADTKMRILQMAAQEFAANDYQKTSLRSICDKAGVTTGALYFFFDSKEDLFQNIVQPIADEIIEISGTNLEFELASLALTQEDEQEATNAMAERVLNLVSERPSETRALVTNRRNPVVAEQRTRTIDRNKPLISRYFEESPALAGAQKPDDFAIEWLATIELDAIMHVVITASEKGITRDQIAAVISFLHGGTKAFSGGNLIR